MTTSELFDKIQNSSIDDHRTTGSVLCQALENLIGAEKRIARLEEQLKGLEKKQQDTSSVVRGLCDLHP